MKMVRFVQMWKTWWQCHDCDCVFCHPSSQFFCVIRVILRLPHCQVSQRTNSSRRRRLRPSSNLFLLLSQMPSSYCRAFNPSRPGFLPVLDRGLPSQLTLEWLWAQLISSERVFQCRLGPPSLCLHTSHRSTCVSMPLFLPSRPLLARARRVLLIQVF